MALLKICQGTVQAATLVPQKHGYDYQGCGRGIGNQWPPPESLGSGLRHTPLARNGPKEPLTRPWGRDWPDRREGQQRRIALQLHEFTPAGRTHFQVLLKGFLLWPDERS
jgi:hypothetical protein